MARKISLALARLINPDLRALRVMDYKDDIVLDGKAFTFTRDLIIAPAGKLDTNIAVDVLLGEGLVFDFSYSCSQNTKLIFTADPTLTISTAITQYNRNRDSSTVISGITAYTVSAVSVVGAPAYYSVNVPAAETFSGSLQLKTGTSYLLQIENIGGAASEGTLNCGSYKFITGNIRYTVT